MTKNKSIIISAFSLFSIFYIGRIVVSLTHMQSIMAGKLSTDMITSIAIAFLLTLLFSLPAVMCVKQRKNPLKIKGLNYLYAVNFIYLAAINVSRFSYFASARLNTEEKSWGFSLLIFIFAVYAAIMGLEGISRFSGFSFFLIALAVVLVIGFNVRNFEIVSLFPVISTGWGAIFKNALTLSSNTAEIVIFLALADNVMEKAVTAFVSAMSAAYFSADLLFLFAVGVMGAAAGLQAFPLYSLSQLASTGNFVRLDVLYTGLWIFAIFIKASVLIYCAGECLPGKNRKRKCIICGLAAFAVSVLTADYMSVGTHSVLVTIVPFLLFSTVIPLVTLIFKKKSKGDKVLEAF